MVDKKFPSTRRESGFPNVGDVYGDVILESTQTKDYYQRNVQLLPIYSDMALKLNVIMRCAFDLMSVTDQLLVLK